MKARFLWILPALMAAAASPAVAQSSISAKVVSVEGERCVLDQGRAAGVRERMIFDVYSKAKVINLPLSGSDEPVFVRQRVIARLIVRGVTDNQAQTEVYGRASEAIREGLAALFNPTEKAENQPPFIQKVSPESGSAFPWRKSVDIEVAIVNEASDAVYFEWSCQALKGEKGSKPAFEGGSLTARRTRAPRNSWICPAQPGTYQITITAYDSAGHKTTKEVAYLSRGPSGRLGSNATYSRVVCEWDRYATILDVGFDNDKTMYVLDGGGGTFGGDPALFKVRVDGVVLERVPIPSDHAGSRRLAITRDYLYLLDNYNSKVKRFRLNPSLATTIRSPAFSFGAGGEGNGKFGNPVDLSVDGDGNVAVLDAKQCAIQVFKPSGVFSYSLGARGNGQGQMLTPVAMAAGAEGELFCLDDGRKTIVVFSNGRHDRDLKLELTGKLTGLAYDPFKKILAVSDLKTGFLQRYSLEKDELLLVRPGGRQEESILELIRLKESGGVRSDGAAGFVVIDREGKSLVAFNAENGNRFGFVGRFGGLAIGDDLKIAASPEGQLVMLDPGDKYLYRVDKRGWMDLRLGGDTFGFKFYSPIDVAVSREGQIFVLDAGASQVLRFTSQGYPQAPYGRAGEGPNELNSCLDLECSGDRQNMVILQERKDHNIHLVDIESERGNAYPSQPNIDEPRVCCEGTDRGRTVWVVNDEVLGKISAGTPTFSSTSLTIDEATDATAGVDGSLYFVDADEDVIVVLNATGGAIGKIKNPRLANPVDIGLDNYGRLYIYDSSTEKVHLMTFAPPN